MKVVSQRESHQNNLAFEEFGVWWTTIKFTKFHPQKILPLSLLVFPFPHLKPQNSLLQLAAQDSGPCDLLALWSSTLSKGFAEATGSNLQRAEVQTDPAAQVGRWACWFAVGVVGDMCKLVDLQELPWRIFMRFGFEIDWNWLNQVHLKCAIPSTSDNSSNLKQVEDPDIIRSCITWSEAQDSERQSLAYPWEKCREVGEV